MADFTSLKTAIQNAIKQNGNEEITGNLLQEILLGIVTTLGDGSINELITALGTEATTRGNADTALGGRIDGVVSSIEAINDAIENGYVYAGIATPSSTPASGKVFYLALTAGTYTNFGNIAVTQGINILKYNGSAWSLDAFAGIDDTPTQGSNNLVKSGGVLDSIIKDGSAFDLSAYNGGATYADLNAALIALNALPAAYKRGGMSMKFILSSDNKYVQYFLTKDEWSASEAYWQKVNLKEELNALYTKVGNLLENVTWVVGSLDTTTGEVNGSLTVYNCSDFVATDGNNKITFSKHRMTCFYDANKSYLNKYVDDRAIEENKTISIPQDAYYFRTIKGVTWDSMVASFGDVAAKEKYNFIKKSFNDLVINSKLNDCLRNVAKEPITTSNYTTYFSSLSDIGIDAIYHIVGIANIDASAPTTKSCFLVNALIDKQTSWQIILESGNNPNIYVRYKIFGNWGIWRGLFKKTNFVVDVNGSGDFTSLTECLVYIRENTIADATVNIKSGVYNIYDEMKSKFGDDYWTNFKSQQSRYSFGLPLYNGIHIKGDNGVVLTCINDQPLAEVDFSFFYAYDNGGATIENIKMYGKNIRYCVHIEFGSGSGIGTYTVRNCSMSIDNSEATMWHHAAGIGAGSGLYTNFVFENNDIHPIFDVAVVKKSAILWHNTAGANPSNKVTISGNFCDADSVVSVATNGTSTNRTPCVISNNSMGGDLLVLNTQEGNISVMAWNNINRNE